jgi:hypothetical protein
MGTGTSRRGLGFAGAFGFAFTVGLASTVLGLAGCGTSQSGAFGWLHPQPPPTEWKVAQIPSGLEFAYPRSWQLQHGDPGTATAALIANDGRFLGYLNLTPRQGAETLANWASFRIAHNADEGDRSVRRLAAATGLRFRTGQGSCVKDSYYTTIGARFVEIACLVSGSSGESVVVGAAPPRRWSQASAVIERSIEGVRT